MTIFEVQRFQPIDYNKHYFLVFGVPTSMGGGVGFCWLEEILTFSSDRNGRLPYHPGFGASANKANGTDS